MTGKRRLAAVVLGAGLVTLSGCRVETNKNGDHDHVKVATPFGGVEVKTNDAAVAQGLGLPVYPGAELKKKKDKDDSSANVNLNFGSFRLGVMAAEYTSEDAPVKVEAFYKKALERYGDVIECQDGKAVGATTQTAEGLTCDNGKGGHGADDDFSGKMELKAGSKSHQHIVAIDSDGSGTKFGVVALNLPDHLFSKDGDDKQPR